MGGTANLAVRGGNLPPHRSCDGRSQLDAWFSAPAVGLAARQNGQVSRSTHFQLKRSG